MKRLLLALTLFLVPSLVHAQCTGPFQNNYVCGNTSGSTSTPAPIPFANFPIGLTVGSTTISNGTTTAPLFNNAGVLGNGLITSTWSTYTAIGTGGQTRTVQARLADYINAIDYGADNTGVADSSTAINNAIVAAGTRCVYLPGGTYKASAISMNQQAACLYGDGKFSTIIMNPTASTPTITVGNGWTGVYIMHLAVDRSVSATSGGDGILWASTGVSDGFIIDVRAWRNYNNFNLGPTAFSILNNIRAEYAFANNIRVFNNTVQQGAQWYANNVYAGQAQGHGWIFQTNPAAPAGGMGTGTIDGLYTFANCGSGLYAAGSAASPVQAVRVTNSFFGQDNSDEITLDTYSADNQITNSFIELAGTYGCGGSPTVAPSGPSGVGSGINATANTLEVLVSNTISNGNSTHGIQTSAVWSSINSSFFTHNVNQGVVINDGTKAVLNANYFTGNAGNLTVSSNSSSLVSVGNFPNSVNYQRGVKFTSSLGANVALNNTANYFDGPSVAQGTVGTWYATGTVTVSDTAVVATTFCKLWDGTTVIASTAATNAAANYAMPVALSGYLASPAGNIRISCRNVSATTGLILFNSSGNSKDATVSVHRIE